MEHAARMEKAKKEAERRAAETHEEL